MTRTTASSTTDRLLPMPLEAVRLWVPESAIETLPTPLYVTPPPSPDPASPNFVPGAWFDTDAVNRVLRFLHKLRQTEGEWKGRPLELLPWQLVYLVGPIFGWKHPDGTRICRSFYCEICRKNGKSTLAAGLQLYLVAADREPGAQVYSAAGDKQQAENVFRPARNMAEECKALTGGRKPRLTVLTNVIKHRNGSFYQLLTSTPRKKHGLNVHGVVVDETHVLPHRELVDVLETSTGSRRQPLAGHITTSGVYDEGAIWWEKREDTRKIAQGLAVDATHYGVVFAADPKVADTDEWKSPKVWAGANPGYGITVKDGYLAKECRRAERNPGYRNAFLQLHLGIPTRATSRWLSIDQWKACEPDVPDPSDLQRVAGYLKEITAGLAGKECFGGLDLASVSDLAAWCLLFPVDHGVIRALWRFWTPEANVERLDRYTRGMATAWGEAGLLTVTSGNVADHDRIVDDITEDANTFELRDVTYDRWNAHDVVRRLQDAEITVWPLSQQITSLSAPSKAFERYVGSLLLRHGGNPIALWHADSVEVERDKRDNIAPVKPDRDRSSKRIDAISAAVNACDGLNRRFAAEDEDDDMPAAGQL